MPENEDENKVINRKKVIQISVCTTFNHVKIIPIFFYFLWIASSLLKICNASIRLTASCKRSSL